MNNKRLNLLRRLDRFLESVLMMLLILVVLLAGYSAYDATRMLQEAKDPSLRNYRPGDSEEIVEDHRINEEQIAWLRLEGTPVDAPIMQAENNFKYLNTDPYGEFSMSGSLFLDCRNLADFSDPYSIIYGHHMENDGMFGALDPYRDPEYILEHQEGTISTTENVYHFHIFCVTEADARETNLFSPSSRETVVARIQETPLFYEEPDDGQIVALTTCVGAADTRRLMVVGTIAE